MLFSESETVKLKSAYVDDVKKEIVAFANTRGGTIYIGVEDDGTVRGVYDPDQVSLQVSNAARDAIKPDVTTFLRYQTITVEGKSVLEIEVQCGAYRPYYIAAKGLRPEGVYVRQGHRSPRLFHLCRNVAQRLSESDRNHLDRRSCRRNTLRRYDARGFHLDRETVFTETDAKRNGQM